MALGKLFMIPVTLGDENIKQVLPENVVSITQDIDTFVVENEKSARRFLSLIKTKKPVRELQLYLLNEHSNEKDIPALIAPLLAGKDVGMLSEAGCPGIADPGALLAAAAHKKGIQVIPLVGPSSILLSLMASGLNGQRFTFLGYLPSEKNERVNKLKEIEKHSLKHNETQIFIETPYRNQHMLEDILGHCNPNTKLCLARNISFSSELIATKTVAEWKKSELPDLHRQPTVFLMLA
jgi:16S rRNA (cytidine1402-2'-O)-methyltransferase